MTPADAPVMGENSSRRLLMSPGGFAALAPEDLLTVSVFDVDRDTGFADGGQTNPVTERHSSNPTSRAAASPAGQAGQATAAEVVRDAFVWCLDESVAALCRRVTQLPPLWQHVPPPPSATMARAGSRESEASSFPASPFGSGWTPLNKSGPSAAPSRPLSCSTLAGDEDGFLLGADDHSFEDTAARRIQRAAREAFARRRNRKLRAALVVQRAWRRFAARKAAGRARGCTLQSMVRNLIVLATHVDHFADCRADEWFPHW